MWKSIETAPKDGSRILVKTENGSPHVAAYSFYNSKFYDVWDTKLVLDNIVKWHPIPSEEETHNQDLLNWINLLMNTVCLLPDVKNETITDLMKARDKVMK